MDYVGSTTDPPISLDVLNGLPINQPERQMQYRDVSYRLFLGLRRTRLLFHIKMVPVPKGRPRMTRSGICFTPKATRDAENIVRQQIMRQFDGPAFLGPLSVVLRFWLVKPKTSRNPMPTVKPDLDNFIKIIDALNGVLWVDDCQIVHIEASKHYCAAGGEPGIDLEVTLLT